MNSMPASIAAALGLVTAAFVPAAGIMDANPPQMAASLSGSSDPAAAARDEVIRDAVAELKKVQARSHGQAISRPWQEMRWLASGGGKVGRLYDLCTGAVELQPTLAGPAWKWESIDPRALSPGDRRKLVEWQMQQVIA